MNGSWCVALYNNRGLGISFVKKLKQKLEKAESGS